MKTVISVAFLLACVFPFPPDPRCSRILYCPNEEPPANTGFADCAVTDRAGSMRSILTEILCLRLTFGTGRWGSQD